MQMIFSVWDFTSV